VTISESDMCEAAAPWVTREVAYTFVFLIGNSDRRKWMRATVNGTLQYNWELDQWRGPFIFRQVDREGNEVGADTGAMSGTRIQARG
jgi:hypothetical protein